MRSDVFSNLGLVADQKKGWLQLWLQERTYDANLFARLLEPSVRDLHDMIEQAGEPPRGGQELTEYSREKGNLGKINQHLNLITSIYRVYEKIIVADAQSGLVLASSNEKDLGVNVSDRSFFKSAVNRVNEVSVEFEKDPAIGITYMIVSIATQRSGVEDRDFTPITALYIDTDEFVKPMLYTGEGLGKSGEIVLVEQDLKIVMSLKHPLPDGTRAEVHEHRIKGEPAILAAGGKEGIIAGYDYRGEPVLAAYRHIVVTPDLSLGMVVKRDQSEVFGPMWQRLIYSLGIGAAWPSGRAGSRGFYCKQNITTNPPVERDGEEVAAGNRNARAEIGGSREVRILSGAFNSMIDRIRNWHEELEEQVKARTVELTESNEKLAVEVAERRRAEQDLAHEKERLAVTLRSIGDGVISADPQGKVFSINRAAEFLTGWTQSDALDRPLGEIFNIINEHTRERCENPVEKVLTTGKVIGLCNDTVLIARDGTERIIADSGAPILDGGNRIIGVVMVFRDATEPVVAQRALEASQQRLELAVVGADLGTVGLEPQRPARLSGPNER